MEDPASRNRLVEAVECRVGDIGGVWPERLVLGARIFAHIKNAHALAKMNKLLWFMGNDFLIADNYVFRSISLF